MKNLIKILMLISVGLFLNSCYYDSFPEYSEEIDPPEIPDVVSYKTDIMPLWEGECVACHSGGIPPDLRPDNSYSSLLNGFVEKGDSENSILYISLVHGAGAEPMPLDRKWPTSQTDLVKAWIDQGAKDN